MFGSGYGESPADIRGGKVLLENGNTRDYLGEACRRREILVKGNTGLLPAGLSNNGGRRSH